jgi:hypothetical protein
MATLKAKEGKDGPRLRADSRFAACVCGELANESPLARGLAHYLPPLVPYTAISGGSSTPLHYAE